MSPSQGLGATLRRAADVGWAAGYDLLCGLADGRGQGRQRRETLVAGARGVVCEVGVGSGLNLPLYTEATLVIGVDPFPGMLARARQRSRGASVPVDLVRGTAEALPLPDRSVDTVVASHVLCSVRDVAVALAEARRVLKPGGVLAFYEHVRDRDPRVAARQARLTPAWRRLARNCHLDRDAEGHLVAAGFTIEDLSETPFARAPAVLRRNILGRARPARQSPARPQQPGPRSVPT